jgi:hypothetical protein
LYVVADLIKPSEALALSWWNGWPPILKIVCTVLSQPLRHAPYRNSWYCS